MDYLFTFAEGVLAFVSPCVLPMLPLFLAYISADGSHGLKARFFNTLMFVLGFTASFALMGATAFSIGSFLRHYKEFLVKLAGVIMVLMGFIYMDFITISLPGFSGGKKGSGLLSNFVFGISYSFAWTPCLGAFLGSALALAGVQDTVFKGVALLICFGLGLGVPYMIFALGYEKLSGVTDFLKKHRDKIKYIGGIFLVAAGVSMVFGLFDYYLALFN